MKESNGCITQIIVISIFGLIAYYKFQSNEKEGDRYLSNQKRILEIEKNKENKFKLNYNFNVDTSFYFNLKGVDDSKFYDDIEKPLIIYFRDNNQNKFNYILNSKFVKSKKDFTYDSIKTVVILEKRYITLGNYYSYSKLKTKAKQEELNMYFFDSKSQKLLKKVTKKGGLPPEEISIKNGEEPDFSIGSAISDEDIIKFIKSAI